MSSRLFYREESLEQTALGRIAKDWSVVSIGDVAETASGGTPSRAKKEYYGGTIPWVKSGELKDNVIDSTEETITDEGLQNSSAKLFRKGTLLVALYGATVGKTAILGIDATTNQAVCAILPKEGKLDPCYLKFQIIARRNELISASSGGAQPNISQGIVRGFRVPLPAMREQHKIAEILSIIEEAIERTDEIMATTEVLKKGLMQQLLTKGIGHKELKDSDIGRIPDNWEIKKLERASEMIMGQSPPGETYNERGQGTPLINGPTEFTERYPRKVKWTTSPTRLAKKGDTLICVRGHTTGRINIADDTYCIGRGVAAIRGIAAKTSSGFLFYVLERNRDRIYQKSYAAGSTFPNITREQLGNVEVAIPPLEEQERISTILSNVDKKLELERSTRQKLERTKMGLMDLLLTGKIRIKVD